MMNTEDLKTALRQEVATRCLCEKARRAARIVSRRYEEALKPSGLRVSQFTMLTAALISEGVTLTELAAEIGLERTTLIRNLKPLERAGIVTVSEEGYRRARTVTVTDQGRSALAAALPLWRNVHASLQKQLGAEAFKAAQETLASLGKLAS
jgi:DNA-binding MarR family transcriptional regulator